MHIKWYLCNWNLTFQVIFKSSFSVSITISTTAGGARCVNVKYALFSLLNLVAIYYNSTSNINSYNWQGPITSMHKISRKNFLIACKSDGCRLRLFNFFFIFKHVSRCYINIFKQVSPIGLQSWAVKPNDFKTKNFGCILLCTIHNA